MEAHAKYTLVGTAIIAAIIGVILFAMWLSRSGEDSETKLYAIYFRQHSLAGLQVDSAVTMRGIRVGNVKGLEISSPDIERIRVIIQVASQTPIKTDSEAIVMRNLLTGLAYVDIINSTSSAPYRVRQKGEDLPVIPEGKPQLEAIAQDLPRLLDQLNEVLARSQKFLSDENSVAVGETLRNIESISKRLVENDSGLTQTLENLTKLSASLNSLVGKIDQRSQQITVAIDGAAQALTLEGQNVSNNLAHISRSLTATFERLQDPVTLLAGPNERALGPGEGKR